MVNPNSSEGITVTATPAHTVHGHKVFWRAALSVRSALYFVTRQHCCIWKHSTAADTCACEGTKKGLAAKAYRPDPRRVLTSSRVRNVMKRGNQIHSVDVFTLGIPKMYMGTLGYKVQILH